MKTLILSVVTLAIALYAFPAFAAGVADEGGDKGVEASVLFQPNAGEDAVLPECRVAVQDQDGIGNCSHGDRYTDRDLREPSAPRTITEEI